MDDTRITRKETILTWLIILGFLLYSETIVSFIFSAALPRFLTSLSSLSLFYGPGFSLYLAFQTKDRFNSTRLYAASIMFMLSTLLLFAFVAACLTIYIFAHKK